MPDQKPPTDVIIKDAEKPLEVVVKPDEAKKDVINKSDGKTLAPETTEQEDITKAGQRRINLIWEFTQGIIAVMITGAIIYTTINKIEGNTLEYAFIMIITMYFIRTNHSLVGGVGAKTIGQSR